MCCSLFNVLFLIFWGLNSDVYFVTLGEKNVLRKIEEVGLWFMTACFLVCLCRSFRRNLLPETSERIYDTVQSGTVGG